MDWPAVRRGATAIGNLAWLGALAAAVIYPILFTFNAAMKDEVSFRINIISPSWPPDFTALAYVARFLNLKWSLIYSVLVCAATVGLLAVAGGLAAYGFTKTKLRFRSVLFLLVVSSMLIPIQVIFTPLFLVLRDLRLLNTAQGLILASAAFQLPVATFLFASYFRRIPNEIIEAAIVDGASTVRILWSIMAPLSRPVLATVGAMGFVMTWNQLLIPLIVVQDTNLLTLTARTATLRGNFGGDPVQLTAGAAIGMLPMLLVYLVAQRSLVAAVTMGASR